MWNARRTLSDDGRVYSLSLFGGDDEINRGEVLSLWQRDESFRTFFTGQLIDDSFTAIRWETPAWTEATIDQPFECVVVNSPGLASHPDESAFRSYFASHADLDIAVFPSLGKDAVLVVPCPLADHSVYGHLATFLRGAPEDQKHELWKRVGELMSERIGTKPIWLSTAGAGVSWLHVRLDSSAKYYHHAPYRGAK